MFFVCYILTQHMSTLEIFNDSALYKCSLNNNNNNNNNSHQDSCRVITLSKLFTLVVLRQIKRFAECAQTEILNCQQRHGGNINTV